MTKSNKNQKSLDLVIDENASEIVKVDMNLKGSDSLN